MKSTIPGGPSLLLAVPPGAAGGPWLDEWRKVLEAWPGDWHILDPDPHYVESWRRRALEHCAVCWTVLPDPGLVPGALAFSITLRTMAEQARVACVSIVPRGSASRLPELAEWTPPFFTSPFASGGVLIVKGPLAAKEALPEPRFYPYDFAEASFRMSQRGLSVLVLPDPSFLDMSGPTALVDCMRRAWHEGRGAAAFRLAHKGRAPRSLKLPESRAGLFLSGPWLVPSTGVRIAKEGLWRRQGAGVVGRTVGPFLEGAALWAGALRGYSSK